MSISYEVDIYGYFLQFYGSRCNRKIRFSAETNWLLGIAFPDRVLQEIVRILILALWGQKLWGPVSRPGTGSVGPGSLNS